MAYDEFELADALEETARLAAPRPANPRPPIGAVRGEHLVAKRPAEGSLQSSGNLINLDEGLLRYDGEVIKLAPDEQDTIMGVVLSAMERHMADRIRKIREAHERKKQSPAAMESQAPPGTVRDMREGRSGGGQVVPPVSGSAAGGGVPITLSRSGRARGNAEAGETAGEPVHGDGDKLPRATEGGGEVERGQDRPEGRVYPGKHAAHGPKSKRSEGASTAGAPKSGPTTASPTDKGEGKSTVAATGDNDSIGGTT